MAVDAADLPAAEWLQCIGRGDLAREGRSVTIETVWGGPSHHAVINVMRDPAGPSPFVGTSRAHPGESFPRVKDRSTMTRVGAPFGGLNNGFEAGYRRFRLVAGSRVVADFVYTSYQVTVVLRVDGDAARVMTAYARQLGRGGKTPVVQTTATPEGSILMVESAPLGGGGATLVTDPTRRWILIRASSD